MRTLWKLLYYFFPGTGKLGSDLRQYLMEHLRRKSGDRLKFTCRRYVDGTRNWQHAPGDAHCESCLPPLTFPFGRSPIAHPLFRSVLFRSPIGVFYTCWQLRASFAWYVWNARIVDRSCLSIHISCWKLFNDFRLNLILRGYFCACSEVLARTNSPTVLT